MNTTTVNFSTIAQGVVKSTQHSVGAIYSTAKVICHVALTALAYFADTLTFHQIQALHNQRAACQQSLQNSFQEVKIHTTGIFDHAKAEQMSQQHRTNQQQVPPSANQQQPQNPRQTARIDWNRHLQRAKATGAMVASTAAAATSKTIRYVPGLSKGLAVITWSVTTLGVKTILGKSVQYGKQAVMYVWYRNQDCLAIQEELRKYVQDIQQIVTDTFTTQIATALNQKIEEATAQVIDNTKKALKQAPNATEALASQKTTIEQKVIEVLTNAEKEMCATILQHFQRNEEIPDAEIPNNHYQTFLTIFAQSWTGQSNQAIDDLNNPTLFPALNNKIAAVATLETRKLQRIITAHTFTQDEMQTILQQYGQALHEAWQKIQAKKGEVSKTMWNSERVEFDKTCEQLIQQASAILIKALKAPNAQATFQETLKSGSEKLINKIGRLAPTTLSRAKKAKKAAQDSIIGGVKTTWRYGKTGFGYLKTASGYAKAVVNSVDYVSRRGSDVNIAGKVAVVAGLAWAAYNATSVAMFTGKTTWTCGAAILPSLAYATTHVASCIFSCGWWTTTTAVPSLLEWSWEVVKLPNTIYQWATVA